MGWFGANMSGRRNKNAFKFVLQLLILSQKQILGVKNVVWGGLEVVWCVSTDPEKYDAYCRSINPRHREEDPQITNSHKT